MGWLSFLIWMGGHFRLLLLAVLSVVLAVVVVSCCCGWLLLWLAVVVIGCCCYHRYCHRYCCLYCFLGYAFMVCFQLLFFLLFLLFVVVVCCCHLVGCHCCHLLAFIHHFLAVILCVPCYCWLLSVVICWLLFLLVIVTFTPSLLSFAVVVIICCHCHSLSFLLLFVVILLSFLVLFVNPNIPCCLLSSSLGCHYLLSLVVGCCHDKNHTGMHNHCVSPWLCSHPVGPHPRDQERTTNPYQDRPLLHLTNHTMTSFIKHILFPHQ